MSTEEKRTVALLDVDATLIFGAAPNIRYNENLINSLLMSGIKDIYIFSSMRLKDSTVAERSELISYLEHKGFNVHGAICATDLIFNKPRQLLDDFWQAINEVPQGHETSVLEQEKFKELTHFDDAEPGKAFSSVRNGIDGWDMNIATRYNTIAGIIRNYISSKDNSEHREAIAKTEKSYFYSMFLLKRPAWVGNIIFVDDVKANLEAVEGMNKKMSPDAKLHLIHNQAKREENTHFYLTEIESKFKQPLSKEELFWRVNSSSLPLELRMADIERFLLEGGDVNVRDKNGNTLLHQAASRGELELANILIKAGADLAAINRYGDSIMAAAKASKNENVIMRIEQLSQARQRVFDVIGKKSVTAADKIQVIEHYLALDGNINVKDKNGNTFLHQAASIGDLDLVDSLIQKGADLAAKNRFGDTVVDAARASHKQEMVSQIENAFRHQSMEMLEQVNKPATPQDLERIRQVLDREQQASSSNASSSSQRIEEILKQGSSPEDEIVIRQHLNKPATPQDLEQIRQVLDREQQASSSNASSSSQRIEEILKQGSSPEDENVIRQHLNKPATPQDLEHIGQVLEDEQANHKALQKHLSKKAEVLASKNESPEQVRWVKFVQKVINLPSKGIRWYTRPNSQRIIRFDDVLNFNGFGDTAQEKRALSMVLYALANTLGSKKDFSKFGKNEVLNEFLHQFNRNQFDSDVCKNIRKFFNIKNDEPLRAKHFQDSQTFLERQCEKFYEQTDSGPKPR